jgi:hypothetical protein
MNMKTIWLAWSTFCFMYSSAIGQTHEDVLHVKFQHGKTDEVINILLNELNKGERNDEKIKLLSVAYADKGSLSEALQCLSTFNDKDEAKAELIEYQANLLKKTGRYKEAEALYLKLAETDEVSSRLYVEGCSYALSLYAEKIKDNDNDKSIPFIVSDGQEIAPGWWQRMLYYGICEPDQITKLKPQNEVSALSSKGTHLNAIFSLHLNSDKAILPGALSTDKHGRRFVWLAHEWRSEYGFTAIQNWGALMTGEMDEKGNIEWIKSFPWNEVGSAIHSASLSPDGNTLYFSSNREGGIGGFDLYESKFNGEGWTEPVNMGVPVNSSWDEITPYAGSDMQLYFATDHPMGLGGFDICKTRIQNGEWSIPFNLGIVVNSTEDEGYPSISDLGDICFSSNRLGSLGGKDIYISYRKLENGIESDMADMPKAIRIDDNHLAGIAMSNEMKDIHTVGYNSAAPLERSKEINTREDEGREMAEILLADLSLARRISVDALLPDDEVFFIQLASVGVGKPNYQLYTPLLKYGNIYKMFINRTVKVRLGYYTDRTEAEAILAKVKSNGFKDAFLAHEWLNKAQIELVLSGSDEKDFADKGNFGSKTTDKKNNAGKTSRYKVRLAAYEDPIWFDVNKVRDLGRVEQWTKSNWTIFILAGFQNLDEAKEARIKAINRGFTSAEVVIDNEGILERLKQQ